METSTYVREPLLDFVLLRTILFLPTTLLISIVYFIDCNNRLRSV